VETTKFKRGDLIYAVNGQKMLTRPEIFFAFEKAVKHGAAQVTVLRGNKIVIDLVLLNF
jgi:type II secretory pathway component PulC